LVTNGLIQVGRNGSAVLTIAGGTNVIRRLQLGGTGGTNHSGAFLMAGGTLRVLGNGAAPGGGIDVNSADFEGGDTDGTGTSVTIGDGHDANAYMRGGSAQFSAMYVGYSDNFTGTYSQSAGTMVILSNLIVGADCPVGAQGPSSQGAIGIAELDSGWLFVTNAAHTAVLDVRNGSFTLQPGGVLVVDNLVVTNGCGSFTNNGGIILPGYAFYTDNLLQNPGAEDGQTSDWTVNGNVVPYVSSFYPHTGKNDFSPGVVPQPPGYVHLMQSVDLGSYQAWIDSGQLLAGFSFWELTVPGSAGTVHDDAQVTLDFLNASSVVLGSISTPELESETQWTNYTGQCVIPVRTRRVNYTMNFTNHTGNAGSDLVYVDDNLLFVSAAQSPPLTVVRAGNNVVLSWPAWAVNFELQSNTTLAKPTWQTTPDVPVAASGRFFVTNSILGTARYYRLHGNL
jgi:hypothetical protein